MLETVLLVADMAELKANRSARQWYGHRGKIDKGRGPVATLLVQRGTLHSGDSIVVGTSYGRVRKMTNDKEWKLKRLNRAVQ